MFLFAPDVYYAAAVMQEYGLCQNNDGVTQVIEAILNRDPTKMPDLGRKILLMVQKKIGSGNGIVYE